jgi:hypothetical protein
MKRYIDIVIVLCFEIKTTAEQVLNGHSVLHRHINMRWNWEATGTYTLWAWR